MRDLRNAVGEDDTSPVLGSPLMGGVSLPMFYRYCSAYPHTGEWSDDPSKTGRLYEWAEPSDWDTVANAMGADTIPTCAIGHYGSNLGIVRGVLPVPEALYTPGILVLLPTRPDSVTLALEPDTIADCLEQIAANIRAGGMLPALGEDGT